jgi:hypothetical protein
MSVAHVSVIAQVGSPICVAAEDGQRLNRAIAASIQRGDVVALSFKGVTRLTTAFLNAALGQLYNEFGEQQIREQIRIEDADAMALSLLKRVIDRAKIFFQNRDKITRATDDEIDNGKSS